MSRSFEADKEKQRLRAREWLNSFDEDEREELYKLLPFIVDCLEEEYEKEV